MNATQKAPDAEPVLREVVGVFFEGGSLEKAISDLKSAGFDIDQLGLLAHSDAVSSKLGHLYEQVSGNDGNDDSAELEFVEKRASKSSANAFLGGLGIIATAAASGAIVASAALIGGPVGAATAGAAVVGGIGALTSTIISDSDSQRLQSYLEEGHLLLFVRTKDNSEEARAKEIISRFSGVDSEVIEFRAKAA